MLKSTNYVAILGPTGSGKSKLAVEFAKKCLGEIVNIDSLTIFKHLDIGTAKPTIKERQNIKHHLLDIFEPYQRISVVEFIDIAEKTLNDLLKKNLKVIILVAGSPLYFYSLTKKSFQPPPTDPTLRKDLSNRISSENCSQFYEVLVEKDPVYALKISPQDKKRIIRALEVIYLTGKPFSSFGLNLMDGVDKFEMYKVGLNPDRNYLKERIHKRTMQMIENGLIEEVDGLLKTQFPAQSPIYEAIGYRETISYLRNEITYDELISQIDKRTFSYAKHQMTWFKRDKNINWYEYKDDQEFSTISKKILDIC